MRQTFHALIVVAVCSAVSIRLSARDPQAHPRPAPGAHDRAGAPKLKNPVAASSASIAAGKELYDHQCASCHGDTAKGDGAMGEELDPKPADLTGASWKHGSADGEIFSVIRDGVKNTGMKPFGHRMTAHQIWDVVNYLHSIGTHPTH